ncbi:hypothetical protein KQX54_012166 [Cotesia glomerata]|uniref:Uncharacterized protein n=1 Tax=Cotesia glomerata TaxID=32391 RepID=A0AAV7HW84_COTGL|nr:hypothetical protein KQX54_012166 [Cotesia glomerata]
MKIHRQSAHKYQCARTENVQPIKLLRRRAGQNLCLTSYNNDTHDVEWYDNEDIDIEKLEDSQEDKKKSVIPVIESMSDWFY